jgi:carbon storage regulator CsrA
MLVLTRKLQEKIQIGDNITITILRTKGKSVRLGIEAPLEVPVIRGELSFDVANDVAGDEESPEAMPAMAGTSASHKRLDLPQDTARWKSKGRVALAADVLPGENARRVSLQRVPRKHVAELLASSPNNGGGPLRGMLDRRSLTA